MKVIGREELITDPEWATPEVRLPKLDQCFALIEEWTETKSKFEVMNVLSKLGIPCGPIMSMKELGEDQALRETRTVVEVEHPERGSYLTVGNPIKLSKSPSDVSRAPLLGEHTDKVLAEIGLTEAEIEDARSDGSI
jgi:formyl-CoA transferase